ncbi:MAG TPA: hypothetical protein PLC61_07825 [Chitinophagales bacterium]|jgi:hypothetical protein|nr:hypothetical protein [Chitinophagales bacterium]MCO5112367.1 hypothetical protein [Burkholderiaceae bacterium]MCO5261193.1 hypothetical protein [Crocinitomicaceae bacterium]MCO5282256.1 hypothetical protein [Saprospiraceae bacterium]HMZ94902.1 hypothetical protein [Chitinophagales bacterium]
MTKEDKQKTEGDWKGGCLFIIIILCAIGYFFGDGNSNSTNSSNTIDGTYSHIDEEKNVALILRIDDNNDDSRDGHFFLTLVQKYMVSSVSFKGKFIDLNDTTEEDGFLSVTHINTNGKDWIQLSNDLRDNIIFYERKGNGVYFKKVATENPIIIELQNCEFNKVKDK